MIRIDLGKDESSKSSGAGADVARKVQDVAKSLKIPPGIVEMLGDVKSLVLLVLLGAISLLPHLFFSQYRSYVNTQHLKAMESLKQELVSVNAEIAKYSAFQSELESYESQKKLVNERLEGVRALLEMRNTPVSVLDAVGQSLPQYVWLDQAVYDVQDGVASVTLSGKAYTNEEISDYMDRLSESIYLQDVKLTEVATSMERNVSVKSFHLIITPKMRQVASKADPAKDGQPAPK